MVNSTKRVVKSLGQRPWFFSMEQVLQVFREFGRRGTDEGVGVPALVHEPHKLWGHVDLELRTHAIVDTMTKAVHIAETAFVDVGDLAVGDVAHYDAKAVDVGAFGVGAARDDFGGHEDGGADALGELELLGLGTRVDVAGRAKVCDLAHDLGQGLERHDEDVLGLEVAVEEA